MVAAACLAARARPAATATTATAAEGRRPRRRDRRVRRARRRVAAPCWAGTAAARRRRKGGGGAGAGGSGGGEGGGGARLAGGWGRRRRRRRRRRRARWVAGRRWEGRRRRRRQRRRAGRADARLVGRGFDRLGFHPIAADAADVLWGVRPLVAAPSEVGIVVVEDELCGRVRDRVCVVIAPVVLDDAASRVKTAALHLLKLGDGWDEAHCGLAVFGVLDFGQAGGYDAAVQVRPVCLVDVRVVGAG